MLYFAFGFDQTSDVYFLRSPFQVSVLCCDFRFIF